MSSFEAIEEVSKVLKKLLEDKMKELGVTASVSFVAPGDKVIDGGMNTTRLNLYLYYVKENSAFKNRPYIHTTADDPLLTFPPLSLSLFYLMTPFIDDDTLADKQLLLQRLLGAAMRVMHEYSIVPNRYLIPYSLSKNIEGFRITINPLSFDDISKIWTSLYESLRLSVSYEVSVVQIASTTLPEVEPRRKPDIIQTEVYPLGNELRIYNVQPAEAYLNTSVSIFGTGFEGEPKVFIDSNEITASDVVLISDKQINFQIPSTTSLGQNRIKIKVGQKESNSVQFEVTDLKIDTILPPMGPKNTSVSIFGTGFEGEPKVFIDSNEITASDVVLISDKQINFKIPSDISLGQKDIKIKVGQKESNSVQFEVTN